MRVPCLFDRGRFRSRRMLVASLLGVGAALAALFDPVSPASWLILEDFPDRVDAAVVLAGDPNYERTLTAARLVLDGEAQLLILTGGEPGPGDSAQSLMAVALRAGVPSERIRLETVSLSTRSAFVAIRPILVRERVQSIAVVTSPYHQRRAYLAARRVLAGVEIYNRPADSSWSPDGWWRKRRSRRIVVGEYGRLLYYWLRGWA